MLDEDLVKAHKKYREAGIFSMKNENIFQSYNTNYYGEFEF